MLHDEVERLNEEDAQKKEQMKQLYETFCKEKSELKRSLENVSAQKLSAIIGGILKNSYSDRYLETVEVCNYEPFL